MRRRTFCVYVRRGLQILFLGSFFAVDTRCTLLSDGKYNNTSKVRIFHPSKTSIRYDIASITVIRRTPERLVRTLCCVPSVALLCMSVSGGRVWLQEEVLRFLSVPLVNVVKSLVSRPFLVRLLRTCSCSCQPFHEQNCFFVVIRTTKMSTYSRRRG